MKMATSHTISKILNRLIVKEEIYQRVDREKILKTLIEIFKKMPLERLDISEEELVGRIDSILTIESVSGILNELSPEEIKDFDRLTRR